MQVCAFVEQSPARLSRHPDGFGFRCRTQEEAYPKGSKYHDMVYTYWVLGGGLSIYPNDTWTLWVPGPDTMTNLCEKQWFEDVIKGCMGGIMMALK